MRAMLAALLTVTILLSVAINAIRWRLPHQPRFAILVRREAKPRSPRSELAIDVGIIAAGCVALPIAAVGLTLLFLLVAAHLG